MGTWIRFAGGCAWLSAIVWAWHAGWVGAVAAGLAGAASLVMWWRIRATPLRRRRSTLRYVHMAKQPVGTP